MGTRSNIAIQLPNGKFKQVYCHWDGYPSCNGATLLEHYQDTKKIKELISLGGISSLGKDLYMPDGTLRDFDCRNHELDVCKFYKSRGDEEEKAVTMQFPICEQEWLYVWMKKFGDKKPRWYYAYLTWNNGYLKPLTEETCYKDKDDEAKIYAMDNHCWLDERCLKSMVTDGELNFTTEFIIKD